MAGSPREAAASFDAALAIEPASRLAALGRAEALLDGGEPGRALELLEPLLGDRPDAWLLAAAAPRALGSDRDADLLLGRARERRPRGLHSPHRGIRMVTLEGVADRV